MQVLIESSVRCFNFFFKCDKKLALDCNKGITAE